MTPKTRTTTSPGEAAVVVAICFGWAIFNSLSSVSAGFSNGTFSDAVAVQMSVFEALCAVLALLFLRFRGYAAGALYPEPTLMGALVAVGLYAACVLAGHLVVSPFYSADLERPISDLVEGSRMSVGALVPLAMVNGAFEEVFLLGFLQRGLLPYGNSGAVGVPLLVRVTYHLYQGPLGALSVAAVGVVLGLAYLRRGVLFEPVFAHVLADIVPFL